MTPILKKKKEPEPEIVKGDRLGRTREQIERDDWYTATVKGMESLPRLTKAPDERFSAATKKSFVEIIRKRPDGPQTYQYTILPGLYDKEKMARFLRQFGSVDPVPEPSDEVSKQIFESSRIEDMLVVGTNMQVAVTTSHTLSIPGPREVAIAGTKLKIEADGKYTYSSFLKAEEYLQWLPTMQAAWSLPNMWCLDIPCREVAHMVNDTERMLGYLRHQLKNLHGVEIYMAQPRWLRYFSDGTMESQRSAQYGKRAAPYGSRQNELRPLLYDNPAWVVGIRMGTTLLPGRVFVNPDGEFICSDWCQREVDKGGGIDLITGASVKHTLATWCAGPGISRFGANDPIILGAHGEVRRARGVEQLLRQHRGQKLTQGAANRMANPLLRPAFRTLYSYIKYAVAVWSEKTQTQVVNAHSMTEWGELKNDKDNGITCTEKYGPDTLRLYIHMEVIPKDAPKQKDISGVVPRIFLGARTNKGLRFSYVGLRGTEADALHHRVADGAVLMHYPETLPAWAKLNYLPVPIEDEQQRKNLYAELVKHNYNHGARQ